MITNRMNSPKKTIKKKSITTSVSSTLSTEIKLDIKPSIKKVNIKPNIKKVNITREKISIKINTFKDLYIFLQNKTTEKFKRWLSLPWKGKDKQESILRLYAKLGLVKKLSNFNICKGNFNLQSIISVNSIKELFYNESNEVINLKDKGDSSDLTGFHKENNKNILITTCKNINNEKIGNYDIDKLLTNFEPYRKKKYNMTLCICCRDSTLFNKMKENIENTNKKLKDIISRESTIIIDQKDLIQTQEIFRYNYKNIKWDDLFKSEKKLLILLPHQIMTVNKSIKLKEETNQILWGHIQRSGKSYIMAGTIIKDSENKKKCNYLIITTCPNETISQYIAVFNCFQLNDFNVVKLNGDKSNKDNKGKTYNDKNYGNILKNKKNIIVCSKQFLSDKDKNIQWLKDLKIDIRFIDETHNGGTTKLAKEMLSKYGKNSFTVYITATYFKPVFSFNIPENHQILWSLEDVKLCQNLNNTNLEKLMDKHGKDILPLLTNQCQIDNPYLKYPNLLLLTNKITKRTTEDIIDKNTDYGWSPKACFLLKQNKKTGKLLDEFQNPEENLKIWYRIFGKEGEFGLPDDNFPKNSIFMNRIHDICDEENSKLAEVSVILCFLPLKEISAISIATKKLLIDNNVVPDYNICIINSEACGPNALKLINNVEIPKAKNEGKKGLIVLAGKQCSLGVSIPECDVVILLNNNSSNDLFYQMMFRCMTERPGKKCGFVIDMDIHRSISTCVEFSNNIVNNKNPKENLKYLFESQILRLNTDHWVYGKASFSNFMNNIYDIYLTNIEGVFDAILRKLEKKKFLLTDSENRIFNSLFRNIPLEEDKMEMLKEMVNDALKENETNPISNGIKVEKIEDEEDNIEENKDEEEGNTEENKDEEKGNTEEKEEGNIEEKEEGNKEEKSDSKNRVNIMDLFKHILPIICLLTINEDTTSLIEMIKIIKNDNHLYKILLDQVSTWWGNEITSKSISFFLKMCNEKMLNDQDVLQVIFTIKELFHKNINNQRKLSELIDKYIIPQNLEKKNNAEISTPVSLRKEMLDVIPSEFWENIHTVFEPCSGKGGFLMDIIDRFMDGLKKKYPDRKKRYRIIVEKCLYFSDINPTNIFINKLLIDPYNEYNLNYNEGDTLELDYIEKWDIESFDAIIGNPPYSTDPSLPNTRPLYNLFIEQFIDNCTYLLFIVPSRWFAGGKGLDKFRKSMLNRKDLQLIVHNPNCKEWFKTVNIEGGVNYFLKNNNYSGPCNFNGVECDLSKYDILITNPEYILFIDKILKHPNILDIFIPRGFCKLRSNDRLLKPEGNIPVYVSLLKSKDRLKYVDEYTYEKFWKVLTMAANGKKPNFGFIGIAGPEYLFTDSYIGFRAKSKKEAKSIESYLRCKLPNFMLAQRKISQSISTTTCKWIPKVPFDRIWDDEQVYEHFDITEDEIKLIEGK